MVNVLTQKALLVNLSMSSWGVRRFDKNAAEEVLTKHQAVRQSGLFTKRLLNKKAMAAIRTVKGAARSYHNTHTQPWMDNGARILPCTLYLEYGAQMQTFKEEFAAAVKEFVKEYPEYIKQAKKELGTLFNADDYPEPNHVRSRFGFEIAIDPVPDKSDFRADLDPALIAQISKDLDVRLDSILQSTVKDAAARITDTVGHMVERLKVYKPANKKKGSKAEGKFHDSLIEHVRELATLLPAFNLANDPKLDALHKRILKELCPNEPDALREDDALRRKVVKEAEAILKQVSEFMS